MDTEEEELSPQEKALFPGKIVTVMSGEKIEIKPWGLVLGTKLNPRCMVLMSRLEGDFSSVRIATLLKECQEEVIDIIARTIGLTFDAMMDDDRFTYEDLFTLAQGVIEVCIIRGADLGGVMGKAAALGLIAYQQGNEASDSPKPSTSSSPTDIPGETSSITPPSK